MAGMLQIITYLLGVYLVFRLLSKKCEDCEGLNLQ
jgi:hypothetical protein